jgi:hypothetical protein
MNERKKEKKKRNLDKERLKTSLFLLPFNMPTYLDTHDLGNMTEEQIKQAQNAPMDEFGVTIKNRTCSVAFQMHLTRSLWASIT